MNREERMRRMRDRKLTYEEIGKVEGISKQRVAQILKPHEVKAEPPRLLTLAAAAAYLGVHRNTLWRWANEGRIKCLRLTNTRRDRRFSREELDKLLQPESPTVEGGDAMKR